MAIGSFTSALALTLCLAFVAGQQICKTTGAGKLMSFSLPRNINVKMPCKYQFSWIRCGADEIKIMPGQEWDFKYRYFTNSLWVSVERTGTPYYWKGRTETKRVVKYLEDPTTREAFNVKDTNMEKGGAPFWMKMIGNVDDGSITLKSANASWKIIYRPSNERNKDSRRAAGIEFICPNAKFLEESMYPYSLCGNETHPLAIKDRKKELGMSNFVTTAMYDILVNKDITQTNPYCKAAVSLLDACPDNKAKVVNQCSKIVRNDKVIKCLGQFHYDPMNVFNDCLRTHCNRDTDACERLQVAMDGCPLVPGVPTGSCAQLQKY